MYDQLGDNKVIYLFIFLDKIQIVFFIMLKVWLLDREL